MQLVARNRQVQLRRALLTLALAEFTFAPARRRASVPAPAAGTARISSSVVERVASRRLRALSSCRAITPDPARGFTVPDQIRRRSRQASQPQRRASTRRRGSLAWPLFHHSNYPQRRSAHEFRHHRCCPRTQSRLLDRLARDDYDELRHTFEEFKAANDERLAVIEHKRADVLLEEKVDRINRGAGCAASAAR